MKQCLHCGELVADGIECCPRCGDLISVTDNHKPLVNQRSVSDMSLGQWFLTLLLTCCLGPISIVMLFVWAFKSKKASRRIYCRALLILDCVLVMCVFIFYIISLCIPGFWDNILNAIRSI